MAAVAAVAAHRAIAAAPVAAVAAIRVVAVVDRAAAATGSIKHFFPQARTAPPKRFGPSFC